MVTILHVECLKFSGHPLLLLRRVLKLRPGFIILNEFVVLKTFYHSRSPPMQVIILIIIIIPDFKIQPLGGACCAGCKNCRSQDIRAPDPERVHRSKEQVKSDLLVSQKNLRAEELHFAAGAYFVQNFQCLCRVLDLSDSEVVQIECDHHTYGHKELAYQALFKWNQRRKLTTVSNLASVLASAGELNAVKHLFEVLSQSSEK